MLRMQYNHNLTPKPIKMNCRDNDELANQMINLTLADDARNNDDDEITSPYSQLDAQSRMAFPIHGGPPRPLSPGVDFAGPPRPLSPGVDFAGRPRPLSPGVDFAGRPRPLSPGVDFATQRYDDSMMSPTFENFEPSYPLPRVPSPFEYNGLFPRRIPTPDWNTKPPCSVIVTIYTMSSYDDLFRQVQQVSPDPLSSIALFQLDHATIPLFVKFLNNQTRYLNNGEISADSALNADQIDAFKQVMDAIAQVQPNSVVFNFECCDHCSRSGFQCFIANSRTIVMTFVKRLLDTGYMVMFADFSLMALINDWDTALLGPNPFVQIGDCHTSMKLTFDAQQLLSCPSGQLQNVGRLNDGISTADLHCMGGTIVCTLKPEEEYTRGNNHYTLEVLTIATQIDGSPSSGYGLPHDSNVFTRFFSRNSNRSQHRLLQIGNHKGYLGHAMIKYKQSGGVILVSSGHWMELNRLDTASEERVIAAVRAQLSSEYTQQLEQQLASAGNNQTARRNIIQSSATHFIQSASPALYSVRSQYN